MLQTVVQLKEELLDMCSSEERFSRKSYTIHKITLRTFEFK